MIEGLKWHLVILAVAFVDELGLCEASISDRSRERDFAVTLDRFPPLPIMLVED